MGCIPVVEAFHLALYVQRDGRSSRFHPVAVGNERMGILVRWRCPAACVRGNSSKVGTIHSYPHRLIVRNGYTGREIEALPVDRIEDVTIEQGPVARFFDVGTVVLRTHTDDPDLVLRGVPGPEVLKVRIDALRPRSKDRREDVPAT